MALGLFNKPVYDEIASTAKAFGDAMVKLGAKYKNVVVLDANSGRFLNLGGFARTFPDRYFNFGNAESNMIPAAAGFTVRGKVPFLCSFSMFIAGRAWEQIRNAAAYPHLNVKFVGAFSGIVAGEEGAAHQALEDIALMRSIPNMKVACPADGVQTKQILEAMMNDYGPTYLRLANMPITNIYDESHKFEFGRAHIYRPGTDVCIFSYGVTFHSALRAAEMLERDGISVMVVNLSSIKPLDESLVIECAKQASKIVTVEDHQIIGGIGSAVCEVLSSEYPVKVVRLGMDGFGESGKPDDLYRKYRLDPEGIYEQIKAL
jgi:transketolase